MEQISQIMYSQTGNTVWTNLILAAIDQDDHAHIRALLVEATVGDKYRDLNHIMHFILHDPVLQVSSEMFEALTEHYRECNGCLTYCANWVREIIRTNPKQLARYQSSLGHII